MPEHGWTCFHCGETFMKPGLARRHFGVHPDILPACERTRLLNFLAHGSKDHRDWLEDAINAFCKGDARPEER